MDEFLRYGCGMKYNVKYETKSSRTLKMTAEEIKTLFSRKPTQQQRKAKTRPESQSVGSCVRVLHEQHPDATRQELRSMLKNQDIEVSLETLRRDMRALSQELSRTLAREPIHLLSNTQARVDDHCGTPGTAGLDIPSSSATVIQQPRSEELAAIMTQHVGLFW